MKNKDNVFGEVVSLAKRRGFIFPSSEIYGGLSGMWDYGPVGAELKNNIKKEWWEHFVYERDNIVGVDTAILMNPRVWEASGHIDAFTDPLIECRIDHERIRADRKEEITAHEEEHHPGKSDWTEPRKFNLLVKALLGVIEGKQQEVFLRGEITQGVHVNFRNVLDSTRVKIPFGIAQIGKAFRNEITPGDFTFRSREFEQFEIQFYIKPDEKDGKKWVEYWKEETMNWYLSLGMKKDNLRFRQHKEDEKAHYAKDAWDIEYNTPFGGWRELHGIHHRADWDLKRHMEFSHRDFSYTDTETGEKYIPWDIESSGGVDRALLFFLVDSYCKEGERVYLKLHPKLAPVKVAVFPLLANKNELVGKTDIVYKKLKNDNIYPIAYDARGNIGKRYYAQDEIGTPFCVTIDFQTMQDDTVTVRDRDTTKQDRISIDKLGDYLKEKVDIS